MSLRSVAPAKLVLLGEYAVLEGAPALVAAVDRTVEVDLVPAADGAWHLATDLPGAAPREGTWREVATGWGAMPAGVIAAACEAAGHAPEDIAPLAVTLRSAALRAGRDGAKLGLGSSAALVVALAHAVRHHLHRSGRLPALPDTEAALQDDVATHARVTARGGSGVDVAAASLGGVLAWRREDGTGRAERAALPAGVAFGCTWTGSSASTTRFLEGVETLARERPSAWSEHVATLRRLAEEGLAACRADDAGRWMDVMHAWTPAVGALGASAGLPIVSSDHRRLADLAEAAGAVYKPSGAGGGDVGIVFARSLDALTQTRRSAEAAGYRWVDLRIRDAGVRTTEVPTT